MSKKTIKKFLKPIKSKLILTLILFLLIQLFLGVFLPIIGTPCYGYYDFDCPPDANCSPELCCHIISLSPFQTYQLYEPRIPCSMKTYTILTLIYLVEIIITYILSCLFVYIYKKNKEKLKF